jgi:hypothetical protein
MTKPQVHALASLLANATDLHHGGAVGADRQAAEVADTLGIPVIEHLPAGRRGSDYLARNRIIVDLTTELIAVPRGMTEELRSGTWATIRYAHRIRKPFTIVYPDGSLAYDTLPW